MLRSRRGAPPWAGVAHMLQRLFGLTHAARLCLCSAACAVYLEPCVQGCPLGHGTCGSSNAKKTLGHWLSCLCALQKENIGSVLTRPEWGILACSYTCQGIGPGQACVPYQQLPWEVCAGRPERVVCQRGGLVALFMMVLSVRQLGTAAPIPPPYQRAKLLACIGELQGASSIWR